MFCVSGAPGAGTSAAFAGTRATRTGLGVWAAAPSRSSADTATMTMPARPRRVRRRRTRRDTGFRLGDRVGLWRSGGLRLVALAAREVDDDGRDGDPAGAEPVTHGDY